MPREASDMVKRWSAAALALLLMGSVAACGDDEESASDKAGEAVEEAGDAAEEAAEEMEDAADELDE
jgi:hypothetical protein